MPKVEVTLEGLRGLADYAVKNGKQNEFIDYAIEVAELAFGAMKHAIRERDEARQRLLTAAGNDLCRLSQEEIKAMTDGTVKIPPEEEFLASCRRFHAQVANESGVMSDCLTLAQLIAENETLRRERDEAREVARSLFG